MKYKTFRGVLIGGASIGAIGGLILLTSAWTRHRSEQRAEAQALVEETRARARAEATNLPALPTQPTSVAPTSTDAKRSPIRPMDRSILAIAAKNMTDDKIKDAFSGSPYKVSFYREGSRTQPARAKVDLDRDEKWDEKWTFEDDGGKLKVKRSVAPNDDEQYRDEFRLEGEEWVRKN